ncbi:MAG: hypothetical protein MR800_00160 [Collinsella sp.]|nr:hypothetical protein [Collinsella sp.]
MADQAAGFAMNAKAKCRGITKAVQALDANDGERCYLEHYRSSLATQTSITDADQHCFDAKAASTKMCNLA